VDTQEKSTVRFSFFSRAVWSADRGLTRQSIAGLRIAGSPIAYQIQFGRARSIAPVGVLVSSEDGHWAVGAESALCLRLCARGAALAVGLAAWLALAVGQGKAEGPQSGAEFRECSGCPAMIVIPAGRFSMGSSKDDADARANERPPHEVRIAGPIAVAKFEATFDEWDACAAAGACPRVPDGWRRGQMPVINVSWNDAKQ
jgi:hypothetical protein